MKKLVSVVLLLACTCLFLGACGAPPAASTSGQSGGAQTSKDEKPATITVAMWGDNSRKELYDELFAPLKEEKNIDVVVQVYPAGEYSTKVLTQIASGQGPDVVWLTERYYPLFAAENVLADMDALMTDSGYRYDDFSQSLVSQYVKDGHLMAIPFTANPVAWFYNKTLFQQAGLEDPASLYAKGAWNVSNMIASAKALTDRAKGVYGLSLLQTTNPTNWPVLLNYFWAQGASFFDDATEKCTINTPEGIRALQAFSDMMFVDECHTKPGDQVSFESGMLGMYQDNPSAAANYQDVDFEWDYICAPTTDSGEMVNVVGVALYSVLNTTPNYDAALEVVKYVTGEAVMEQLIATFSPPRQSLKASDAFMNATQTMPTPEARKILYLDVFDHTTKTYPATTNWADVDLKVIELMDKLYTNSYPVEEVAAQLEQEVNVLLEKQ